MNFESSWQFSCQVTGKTAISGHKVSHSNVKTKRRSSAQFADETLFPGRREDKWMTLKVCSEAIRTINKKGLLQGGKGIREQTNNIN